MELITRIADKYLIRKENIERAWVRALHHLPETLAGGDPLDILEFSTAHGAMLEIWRAAGHRVRGTDWDGWPDDYAKSPARKDWLDAMLAETHDNPRAETNRGWVYQPIIEATGLDVDLFDAGARPYPYRDKSYDVVCCYQALEAYAPPAEWPGIVGEFCRIARQSVVVGFNPPPRGLREDAEHFHQQHAAFETLRTLEAYGLKAVFLEFGETNAGFHPTALKLMAVPGAKEGPAMPAANASQVKQTGPKGDTFYKARARNYETRRKKQDWWHVEQEEMKSLLFGLPRGLSVVDIPFGTGRFVPYYKEFGYTITGLDVSQDMFDAAREALGPLFDECTCVTGDAAELPFDDAGFDLVVSTRFLRDIVTFSQAKAILAEMARVTSRYAILQLGENPDGEIEIGPDDVMGGALSRASVDALLAGFGFRVLERRLVKSAPEVGEVYHILCEKTDL